MFIEHLRIPIGSGVMHAERMGRGNRPVVFLHGFGTCAFLWRSVAAQMASEGFTAISLDLLGYGESDRPDDASYGLVAQAEYVERALTSLRLPAIALVGQDIGALIGALLSMRSPERVVKLAMINPSDPDDLPGPDVRALQRTSAKTALGANALFGVRPLLEPLLHRAVANESKMSDRLIARYLAPFVGPEGVSELLQLASAIELDEEDPTISTLEVPALLIHGILDPWTTRDVIDRVASQLSLPPESIVSIPGAGRLVAEDAPERLVELLRDWMQRETTVSTPALGGVESRQA